MHRVAELEIPSSLEYVSLARLVISSVASSESVIPEAKIDDLKLAISEACTNAIEAHESAGSNASVLICCDQQSTGFEITVTDHGQGFDPSTLSAHPSVTDPERLNFERGLGVPLIRSLVDEVEFLSSDDGTSVKMTLLTEPADDNTSPLN